MLSTIAAGRALFISSIKLSAPRYANHAVQFSKAGSYGLTAPNIGVQPIRFLSKSNATFSRFGMRSKVVEKATRVDDASSMVSYGNLAIGIGGAAGLGALCYYGVGLSNEENIMYKSLLWPQYVRERIHSTYAHLGVGCGISIGAAYATFKSPVMMRFFSNGSIFAAIGSIAALVVSHSILRSIPYEPGLGSKQLAWVAHCSLLGMMLAPLSMFGGLALVRAASYTAGIVTGLSAIAVCAPSEKFLNTAGPISIALGAIVASSIGGFFFPPTSRIGLGLYGVSLYGGLLVFSYLLMHDTQKVVKQAELHPTYSMKPYDPINNSVHLYMDILNIFIRMVQILALNGQRRK